MKPAKPSMILLAIAGGTSPFGMAIILPAIPEIVDNFNSSYAVAQLVVSGYLLGVAVAQPLMGFFCDRFGRRRVLLFGFGTFVIASIGCSFAMSLPQLVTLRVLQAVGASTGTVASRAIIRDIYSAELGTKAMSFLTIGLGIAPVVAPMLGGWLLSAASLKAVFLLAAGIGVAVWISLFLGLAETRDRSEPEPQWKDWPGSYRRLLTSRPFIGYTLIFGFVQGSFFAFLAVGAAVFETSFGIGPSGFGVVWGGMAIAFVIGAVLGGRLSTSMLSPYVFPASMLLTLLAGLLLIAFVVAFGVFPGTVLVPMFALMTLSGIVTPRVMAGPVYHHADIAGTSAGLSSALGLVVGSSFTIAAGLLYAGDFLPIAVLIAIATTLTAASWLIVRGYGTAPA